jgi:hypothetical protein
VFRPDRRGFSISRIVGSAQREDSIACVSMSVAALGHIIE